MAWPDALTMSPRPDICPTSLQFGSSSHPACSSASGILPYQAGAQPPACPNKPDVSRERPRVGAAIGWVLLCCCAAVLLSCYPAILLCCYPAVLLSCYPAILLSCYPAILLCCCAAMLLWVIMGNELLPIGWVLLSCYPAILLCCYPAILLSCYPAILLSCCAAVLLCCYG